MDLTTRKYSFIERFMSITSIDKIERLEKLLNAEIGQEEMPKELKQVLDIGLAQIEEGKTKSALEVTSRIKKKYNIA